MKLLDFTTFLRIIIPYVSVFILYYMNCIIKVILI